MKPYITILILLSLFLTVFLQEEKKVKEEPEVEEESNDDDEDTSVGFKEELMSALEKLGYGNKTELTKQEYSQVMTKYLMRGSQTNDFEYVKIVDKMIVIVMRSVPEIVKVEEMDKYLTTEAMTEVLAEILGRDVLKDAGKDGDL